jgi:hypothetical protein
MDPNAKALMAQICDRLTPAQIDDAESQHDNLEVLLDKVGAEYDVMGEHTPGLDAIMHDVAHEFLDDLRECTSNVEVGLVMRNALLQVFWFGYESGLVKWPLKRLKCREAHT